MSAPVESYDREAARGQIGHGFEVFFDEFVTSLKQDHGSPYRFCVGFQNGIAQGLAALRFKQSGFNSVRNRIRIGFEK